jgi:hypothetical protein
MALASEVAAEEVAHVAAGMLQDAPVVEDIPSLEVVTSQRHTSHSLNLSPPLQVAVEQAVVEAVASQALASGVAVVMDVAVEWASDMGASLM